MGAAETESRPGPAVQPSALSLNNIIVLDTGVLGMLVHPTETGEPRECKAWLKQLDIRGVVIYVPEIADYELRRELLRMRSAASVTRLDELKTRFTR